MTVGEIVRRVRSAIDEIVEADSEIVHKNEDIGNLDRIIIDKIGYALQYVIENAPIEKLDGDMLENLTEEEQSSFGITDLVAKVRLPDDLLRIVEARLSSWSHFPPPEPASSQVYLMQQDKYARGSWDRPVNVITHEKSARYLEMYSAKSASDTLILVFVRKPKVPEIQDSGDENTDIDVPSQLTASLIYQIAGLTMVAFREDIADSLLSLSKKYLMETEP